MDTADPHPAPLAREVGALATTDRFPFDVAIVGLGYVGLPTALAYHAAGLRVVGVDIDPRRLGEIRARDVDLIDTDRERLARALDDPTMFVIGEDLTGVGTAAAVVVCVPTPVDHHLVPDLSALRGACGAVVAHATPGQAMVLTSTSYVGCTRDLLVRPLAARDLQVGRDVFVAFSPERINPGDSAHPHHAVPRIVGGATRECLGHAERVLAGTASKLHPVSSLEAAELTKLYENTFRAVNISLANEFATIARTLQVDIGEVIDAAATKPYGFMAFRPGPGVGGHCIPCDPHYLLWQLRAQRIGAPMIETAMTLIAQRPGHVVGRAVEVLAEDGRTLAGASILVVGVAYKPGVSDVRESPALEILERLAAAGASVSYVDDFVPTLRVSGSDLASVADPQSFDWDLVLVHTLHPRTDHQWIGFQRTVLDATYSLDGVAARHLP